MALFRKKKTFAIIFDDKGKDFTTINITNNSSIFHHNKKTYNVMKNEASYFEIKGYIRNKEYYFYTINNPNPILMDRKAEPILNSEIYNIMIKTEMAKKLNDMNRFNIAEYLTPKNLIIAIVLIIIFYFFATGRII